MNAIEIFNAVREKYHHTEYYSDSGRANIHRYLSGYNFAFVTSFSRKEDVLTFKLLLQETDFDVHLEVRSGKASLTRSTNPSLNIHDDFELSRAVLRAQSQGISEIVLPLLLRSESSSSIFTSNFDEVMSQEVNGKIQYRVRCSNAGHEIKVRAEDFAILSVHIERTPDLFEKFVKPVAFGLSEVAKFWSASVSDEIKEMTNIEPKFECVFEEVAFQPKITA